MPRPISRFERSLLNDPDVKFGFDNYEALQCIGQVVRHLRSEGTLATFLPDYTPTLSSIPKEMPMAQTYQQLQKQIRALQRQADELKSQEVGGVIARIKEAIDHYGLTAEHLGLGAASGKTAGKKATGKPSKGAKAKYSNELGQSWGGMGPRPQWLRSAIEAGKSLEDFLVGKTGPAAKPTAGKPAGKKVSKGVKRRAKAQYKHPETGRLWAGMGPRPQWLKDLVASGKTLEELAV